MVAWAGAGIFDGDLLVNSLHSKSALAIHKNEALDKILEEAQGTNDPTGAGRSISRRRRSSSRTRRSSKAYQQATSSDQQPARLEALDRQHALLYDARLK